MMVWNGGVRLAGMNPHDSMLAPDARDMAAKALRSVIISNSASPTQLVEPGFDGDKTYGEYRGWLDGPFRP